MGVSLVVLHATCAVLDSWVVFLPTYDCSSYLRTYSIYSYYSCLLCEYCAVHSPTLLTTITSTYTPILDVSSSLRCTYLAGLLVCRRDARVLGNYVLVTIELKDFLERTVWSTKAVVWFGTIR